MRATRRADRRGTVRLPAGPFLWALLAAWVPWACAAGGASLGDDELEPMRVRPIEVSTAIEVLASDEGLAAAVQAVLSLKPKDPVTLEVLGRRPEGQPGDDAVVEFEVRWSDFVGVRPTSFGGSFRRVLPFGEDGEASRAEPLKRSFDFVLPAADAQVLARRVTVWARLHPVDLVAGRTHTGGASQTFERQALLTFRRRSEASLEELILAEEDAEPGDLFLAATATPFDEGQRLGQLIDALSETRGTRRDELFGALQCLTGETHGRNVYRWQAWWRERLSAAPGS